MKKLKPAQLKEKCPKSQEVVSGHPEPSSLFTTSILYFLLKISQLLWILKIMFSNLHFLGRKEIESIVPGTT